MCTESASELKTISLVNFIQFASGKKNLSFIIYVNRAKQLIIDCVKPRLWSINFAWKSDTRNACGLKLVACDMLIKFHRWFWQRQFFCISQANDINLKRTLNSTQTLASASDFVEIKILLSHIKVAFLYTKTKNTQTNCMYAFAKCTKTMQPNESIV